MHARITLLPGDGIGPEVVGLTRGLLETVAQKFGHTFTFQEALMGGCALDAVGNSLPPETIVACEASDAVLLGAVGGAAGSKWSDPNAPDRPERGLLALRAHFKLFANLRPVTVFPALATKSPLRPELLTGVDILFVRELTGGAYFGEKHEQGSGDVAWDTMIYSVGEVRRVLEVALKAARGRRKHVISIDKANVLASSRLWRRTVDSMRADYPDVTIEHGLVDSFAMQLIRTPNRYDVVVAENMFGDILTDESAVLAGSLGMLPSASLGSGTFGVYEPIHGAAPDIAGKGIANPTGTILSGALLLRHSLGLEKEAVALETAVRRTIDDGLRTADLVSAGEASVGSTQFAEAVRGRLTD
ncbi:MAG: 3-isopropylmalate dehydrogenase [Aggregatilineales bacterium]